MRSDLLVIGASERLGGELCKLLVDSFESVFIITTNRRVKADNMGLTAEQSIRFSICVVDDYAEMPLVVANIYKNAQNSLTVCYLLSTGGRSTLLEATKSVVNPVIQTLEIETGVNVSHVFISSQLATQIGFEKGLTYHLEKALIEKVFFYYAIRSRYPTHRYNVVRLTHLIQNAFSQKYSDSNSRKFLVNVPYRGLVLPRVSDLAHTIEYLSLDTTLNGAVIDLDQGGRKISATSERSGYREQK